MVENERCEKRARGFERRKNITERERWKLVKKEKKKERFEACFHFLFLYFSILFFIFFSCFLFPFPFAFGFLFVCAFHRTSVNIKMQRTLGLNRNERENEISRSLMDLRSLRKHLHFLMVFRIPILCSYVVLVMKRRNGYGKSCLPEASVCFFTNHRIFCVLLLIFFFIFLFVFRQRVTLQNSLYVSS